MGAIVDTTGSQEAAVQAATVRLEAAQSVPKFCGSLLMLSAGGGEKRQRVAAATYLMNLVTEGATMTLDERLEFRNQLVEVVLRSFSRLRRKVYVLYHPQRKLFQHCDEFIVISVEGLQFRFVADNDFAKKMT